MAPEVLTRSLDYSKASYSTASYGTDFKIAQFFVGSKITYIARFLVIFTLYLNPFQTLVFKSTKDFSNLLNKANVSQNNAHDLPILAVFLNIRFR